MREKVWIINHYASDMFTDKSGRHFWFAKKLEERGYIPTIICANTFHNKKGSIDTGKMKYRIEYDDATPFIFIKTKAAFGNGLKRIENMFIFFINIFPAIKAYLKQNSKPDIIIASSVHPLTMVAGLILAKKMKIPCICEVRDLWPEAIFAFGKASPKSIIGRIMTTGEHWIYKKATAIIFTKEGDVDYIKEMKWDIEQGGDIDLDKCHYINNGINSESFERHIKDNLILDSELTINKYFNVIYTGMIRPVNDIEILIDCAKQLIKHEDIQFLIYGDGSQLEILKGKVKAEGLTNVHMKGFIARKYIPYVLSKSSVNILNYSQSKYNWKRGNSSNKLFEYMASGKPVISTVKMGYCIISKYNCGMSLEECTSEALANAILSIKSLSAEEYEILCTNAKNGSREFDFNKLTDKLIDVIEKITCD